MYEVKVLSDKDFDSLPKSVTRGSDISMSLGFADPKTNKAYVRYVGHAPMQKYLINHEFEEMVNHESAHEDENGIRHKNFWDVFFWPFGAFMGGQGGGGGGGSQPYQPVSMSGPYQPISSTPQAVMPVAGPSATSQVPSSMAGNVAPRLNEPSMEEIEKQRRGAGFYSGRLTF